uniref:Uncharacterized protein n=1 Tax=Oryza glumipatula TaxID=40148 RepID=A0A0D9ZI56_9ORYZ
MATATGGEEDDFKEKTLARRLGLDRDDERVVGRRGAASGGSAGVMGARPNGGRARPGIGTSAAALGERGAVRRCRRPARGSM